MLRRALARPEMALRGLSPVRLSALAVLVSLIAVPALAQAGTVGVAAVAAPACETSGSGLVLSTPAPLHYVPAGGTPVVTAKAAAGEIRYMVRERAEVLSGAAGSLLTASASPAGVSLVLPEALPGFYAVSASLVVDGAVVAKSCLTYGVGAAGSSFDPAGLPAGADWGGPAPERSVAIHDALGFNDVRLSVNFGSLFKDGKLDASSYDAPFAKAVARAAAAGIAVHVQVGANGPAEVAAVKDHTWEPKVEQLVRHFAGVVPAWEAWNEPDAFYSGTATSYVKDVLVPFARAVRKADPSAKVIGASTLGFNSYWYDEFARAGGFGVVDVVAIHPYASDNRTWTEQGTVATLQKLRALMARNGAGNKPIWNTESAWWSTGDYNLYDGAGRTAESLFLARTLGVRMAAFEIEGGWQDWSLIDPRTRV
jgi:hypothetical protein